MSDLKITLGKELDPANARMYTVRPLPRKPNAEWRQSVVSQLTTITGTVKVSGIGSLLRSNEQGQAALVDLRNGSITLDTIRNIAGSAEQFVLQLAGVPDFVYTHVLAYAPEIAADAEWIDQNVTESELLDAFMQILTTLVFPLGKLTSVLGVTKQVT